MLAIRGPDVAGFGTGMAARLLSRHGPEADVPYPARRGSLGRHAPFRITFLLTP
jgi:hypothetical protein